MLFTPLSQTVTPSRTPSPPSSVMYFMDGPFWILIIALQMLSINADLVILEWYPDISLREFLPLPESRSVIQYVGFDNCHESNFYLSNTLLSSIPTSI